MNAQRWRHSPGLTQVILEKTIIKLGSLLALGFGEASVFKAPRDVASLFSQFAPGGANIIEHNMHGVDSACVDVPWQALNLVCLLKRDNVFVKRRLSSIALCPAMPSNARSRLFWGSECHAESCWVMLSENRWWPGHGGRHPCGVHHWCDAHSRLQHSYWGAALFLPGNRWIGWFKLLESINDWTC